MSNILQMVNHIGVFWAMLQSSMVGEYRSFTTQFGRRAVVLSTYQGTIPARNAVDKHAHDFVATGELLLSIPSASAQCSR